MSLNFIVPQIPEVELAKMMHEAAREAVNKGLVVRRDVPNNGFIEWDQLDDAAREGRLIQARFLLAHYCITDPDDITELDESLDCARRDCVDAQQKLLICHTAMVQLIGVETNAELQNMKTVLTGIAALTEDPKDANASIALIDALIDTGYRNDGTCAGDAAKCCGNCGDMVGKDHPEPLHDPVAIDDTLLEKQTAECCGGKNCGGAES